jgi:hypothetical protein
MNKMFVLYFALLHEPNVYFIFCSSSKWKRNNKKKSNIYKFMFKFVERRKFTETAFESASYTYTVRVHCIYNKKKLKNLFDLEYLKI